MADPPTDREHEELEHIPWSMLAKELNNGRSQTKVVFGLVLILVAVVVFVGVRSLRQTAGTVIEVPGDRSDPEVTAPATTNLLTPPVAAASAATTTTTPVSAALYSEADLMAVAPEREQALAAARAEWLVMDHFTVGDAAGEAPAALWVEWARTIGVTATGPAQYQVAVVFSTLVRTETEAFGRMGLRAVEVPIRIDADGDATPTDLPSPLALSGWDAPEPPVVDAAEVPEPVAAAAIEMGEAIGSDVQVVGGSLRAGGWRVTIAVAEPGWPPIELVVDVPG